ncbi:hypothetical protein DL98DRAFT_596712 [Cadophora sp. DSE1049]|nr:hypothetical protein DL98DRAFT_596712 [Cadophora sp. DSE1049]
MPALLPPSPRPPSAWASVMSIAPPPPTASPVSVKNGTTITINKKPTPTPVPAKPAWVTWSYATVLDKIKHRTINNKFCHNHYLRGPCGKGMNAVSNTSIKLPKRI